MRKVKDLMNLKGRVALITGAGGYLGNSMAEALAEAGADIALLDIDRKACEKNARRLQQTYRVRTMVLVVDLTDDEQVCAVPALIRGHFKRLDILIHSAALVGTARLEGWAVPFEKQSIRTWRKALDVNLSAVFLLTQKCAPLLKKSGHGAVINISSIYGLVGPDMKIYQGTKLGNPAAYNASKGGLVQLTRWLASNMAPEVRVNTISMGGVFRQHKKSFVARYSSRTLLGRMAGEDDIKGAALFLASDLSAYVTGQNIIVDGGWTAC